MNIYSKLPRPFFVLAPLDDVTDIVFRQVIAECSPPDLFFTEFVNVDGLQSPGRKHLIHKLKVTKFDKPIIAQLWGKNPENFYKTAAELFEMGFAGVDLNMGCPIKNVVKNGCCSALINDRVLAIEIIKATQNGVAGKLPVSVKTRLGFNEIDLSWHSFLLEQNLASLTIHGRTRKEMSLVPAHWDTIGEIVALRNDINSSTLIVGNGDIKSREQGINMVEKYGLDGIMIGRGVFDNPYVFSKDSIWEEKTPLEKAKLYKHHIELFIENWGTDSRNFDSLKKFAKVYINEFEGSKLLRDNLMRATSAKDMITLLD